MSGKSAEEVSVKLKNLTQDMPPWFTETFMEAKYLCDIMISVLLYSLEKCVLLYIESLFVIEVQLNFQIF